MSTADVAAGLRAQLDAALENLGELRQLLSQLDHVLRRRDNDVRHLRSSWLRAESEDAVRLLGTTEGICRELGFRLASAKDRLGPGVGDDDAPDEGDRTRMESATIPPEDTLLQLSNLKESLSRDGILHSGFGVADLTALAQLLGTASSFADMKIFLPEVIIAAKPSFTTEVKASLLLDSQTLFAALDRVRGEIDEIATAFRIEADVPLRSLVEFLDRTASIGELRTHFLRAVPSPPIPIANPDRNPGFDSQPPGAVLSIDPALMTGRLSPSTTVRDQESEHRGQHLDSLVVQLLPVVDIPTPTEVLQARRNAEARALLLREFGGLTSAEVADVIGSEAKNRGSLAHRWRKEGRLLGVTYKGTVWYPAFQFQNGDVLPVVSSVLGEFAAAGLGDWEIAIWFGAPNGWLDDRRPVQLLLEEPDSVVEAARHEVTDFVG